MSCSKFKIIAGLGNPGKGYAQTRHNIGFLVVEALASKSHLTIDKTRFESHYVKGRIKDQDVFIIKPLTYMNLSGFSIHRFASYYKVGIEDIIIVHDDMDLAFGKIKIVKSRGHGGHNGVRSILEVFGKKDCIRIRVGVGHPGSGKDVTGHVLGGFSPDEIKILDHCIDTASDACLCVLENGVTSAMNLFNTKS
ncbi:aminoacyl-tRNA hydrolase [Desulfobacula phenolica]|uniref:Peptidyl-tRNA hydrolase n=1 Tax=Desulfobacula phenolica TaxID=90732 RepID=A0A1H2DMT1_9BACT|nr:aminoacyl-tRNA hydrolase [Desulfobacula phenolica]SDT84044.1 peptidyl-tRNA hydrolase, PTH1 family [Desulfobacula phenolica]